MAARCLSSEISEVSNYLIPFVLVQKNDSRKYENQHLEVRLETTKDRILRGKNLMFLTWMMGLANPRRSHDDPRRQCT